jgi:preprotein translocase subunit SecE
MSRAMRRQPLVQKPPAKTPGFRPSGRPAKKTAATAAAAAEAARKRTFIERIPILGRPAQDIVNELKKVTWPTREETTRLTVAVLAVTITIGLLLGGVDIGFNWLADNTLLR